MQSGMNSTATDPDVLEQKLNDVTAAPIFLPLQFLEDITCNFSSERKLGSGGYGVVYKGVLPSGRIIAVKKLFGIHLAEDKQFQHEASSLVGIKHQNIVQLVGYCAESRWEATKLPNGYHYIMGEIPTRLLCFEYLCNGSLDRHVSDETTGLHWSKRHEIIKGICSGLCFLHDDCHIVHLDLKPQNVLLDATMVPKIADFGLSRLLGTQKSRTINAGSPAGTPGYMAPEYIHRGEVSPKADIFSFGVIIIEMITGSRDYPQSFLPYFQNFDERNNRQIIKTSQRHFTDKVVGLWRNIFQSTQEYTSSSQIYTQQVKQWITIALKCVEPDSRRRPSAREIIKMIETLEELTLDMQCEDESLVQVSNLENSHSPGSMTEGMLNQETVDAACVTSEEGLSAEHRLESSSGQDNDQGSASASGEAQSVSANNEPEDTDTEVEVLAQRGCSKAPEGSSSCRRRRPRITTSQSVMSRSDIMLGRLPSLPSTPMDLCPYSSRLLCALTIDKPVRRIPLGLPSALSEFEKIVAASEGNQIVMFLDYDGTLSPIVNNPDFAIITDMMRASVHGIAMHFPTVIFSERCSKKVFDFVKLAELLYVGSHGKDIKGSVNAPSQPDKGTGVLFQQASEFLHMIEQVHNRMVEKTGCVAGTTKVENSKFCVSVDRNLGHTYGRMLLEVRPTIMWDKGKALELLLESLGFTECNNVLPVYIGDDSSDEDAFKVLRQRGQGVGILVSKHPKETSASYSLREPSEVGQFLRRLVNWKEALQTEATISMRSFPRRLDGSIMQRINPR